MAATMVAPLSLNEGMSLSLEPDKILFDEFAVKEASILPAVPKPDLLVTSPYTELPHLLDLSTLDTPNQLLARALVDLKFIREDHRTAPYIDSFNWTEIFDSVRRLARESNFKWNETEFYIVVFRSQIPPTTEYSHLGALDKDAHAEAVASGGFLKYVAFRF